jgi:hypothetical protein
MSADPAGFFDVFGLTRWHQLSERYTAYEGPPP